MSFNPFNAFNWSGYMKIAERDAESRYEDSNDAGPGPEVMGADTLIGNDVCNLKDETLGEVKEIMLDTATGRVAYAVLSYGGLLGLGDKLFAVPWNALELDTENKRFLLDIDKEALKSAPGFDKDAWPRFADASWAADIHQFYRADPYWTDSRSRPKM